MLIDVEEIMGRAFLMLFRSNYVTVAVSMTIIIA